MVVLVLQGIGYCSVSRRLRVLLIIVVPAEFSLITVPIFPTFAAACAASSATHLPLAAVLCTHEIIDNKVRLPVFAATIAAAATDVVTVPNLADTKAAVAATAAAAIAIAIAIATPAGLLTATDQTTPTIASRPAGGSLAVAPSFYDSSFAG